MVSVGFDSRYNENIVSSSCGGLIVSSIRISISIIIYMNGMCLFCFIGSDLKLK